MNGPLLCGFNVPIKGLKQSKSKKISSKLVMYVESQPSHLQRVSTLSEYPVSMCSGLLSTTDIVHQIMMYPTCWSRAVVCCMPFVCYTLVSLQDVFLSTILAKIQYYFPVWSGYCSAADRARLDGFLKRCKRRGFCEKELSSITEIFDDTDNIFFAAGIL